MYQTNKLLWPVLFFVDVIGYIFFFWRKLIAKPINPKKILVIRLDHLGDAILTSAMLSAIKKQYPRSRLTVLCRPLTKPVFELMPFVDSIITVNVPWFSRGKTSLLSSVVETLSIIREYLWKYDLVFEVHTDPRNIVLASLIGKYVVGYDVRGCGFLLNQIVIWEDRQMHIVERTLLLLEAFGINSADASLSLTIPTKVLNAVQRKYSFTRLIHPLSARSEKNLPLTSWKEYVNSATIIGGAKDQRPALVHGFGSTKIICDLSVVEYLALIYLAKEVYTVDTFVVHARAAFGLSVCAYYSTTSPVEWGYWKNGSKTHKKVGKFDCWK